MTTNIVIDHICDHLHLSFHIQTFTPAIDKVKVTLVLITLLALQAVPRFMDQFGGKPHLFSSQKMAYAHLAATILHLVVSFAFSFSNGGDRFA
jgi:hypothetical protein